MLFSVVISRVSVTGWVLSRYLWHKQPEIYLHSLKSLFPSGRNLFRVFYHFPLSLKTSLLLTVFWVCGAHTLVLLSTKSTSSAHNGLVTVRGELMGETVNLPYCCFPSLLACSPPTRYSMLRLRYPWISNSSKYL